VQIADDLATILRGLDRAGEPSDGAIPFTQNPIGLPIAPQPHPAMSSASAAPARRLIRIGQR